MLRSVLVASVLVLAACSPSQGSDEDLLFDPCQGLQLVYEESAAVEEIDDLVAATESWNERAGTLLVVTPDPAPDAPILPVHFERAAPLFFGVYEASVGEIYINERMPSSLARTITITHELGHAFGLVHVTDRQSLMNEGNLETGILESDIESLDRLWPGCPAMSAELGSD